MSAAIGDAALYFELAQLYARYADVLDRGDWDQWPGFFTKDCLYSVQPRENFERGLPLATVEYESRGMLMDRVYGIRDTLFHDPYYQRHVIGPVLLQSVEGERIRTEANYAVFRTKASELSTVYNVGRYIDEIVRSSDGLRFAAKRVIYDSEMIPNSLIYPI